MIWLLRAVGWSYLRRHPGKSLLAVVGIASGVAMFTSVRAGRAGLELGLQTTVDRLAGRATLQISGGGGVPEPLREQIRELPEVLAAEPVIEQVVAVPATGERTSGPLLIVGVDLVGDRHLRSYSFSGDDADVDDPLVFLAQPDSVAVSRSYATRAGLVRGDRLTILVAGQPRKLTVRALLEPQGFARAYGGDIAVTDVYAAQDVFGRGRRFDRIDIRLQPDIAIDDGIAAIRKIAGDGYSVETPARRGREAARFVDGVTSGFDIAAIVAIGLGAFVIFNVGAVGVHRRRRDIGVMRTLGVTPRQITALFLLEGACLGLAGAALGAWLGHLAADRVMAAMSDALAITQGMSARGEVPAPGNLVPLGLIAGTVAALIGAWRPARAAAAVAPVTSLASGTFAARGAPVSRRDAVLGMAALAAAFVTARFGLVPAPLMLPVVAICGAVGASLVAVVSARMLAAPLARVLRPIGHSTGRIGAHFLVGYARRTAGTAAVLAVTLAFVFGVAGYLDAVRQAVGDWVERALGANLIVRASTGLGPSAVRLDGNLRERLAAVPGVFGVSGVRQERVRFRDAEVMLVALDTDGFGASGRHDFVAGDQDAFARALPAGACVVSDNFARRYGVGVGADVELMSPSGPTAFRVAAIVTNFLSDRGTVLIARQHFTARWQDTRVDAFHLTLTPAGPAASVREAVRAALPAEAPAVVSSRAEVLAEADAALDALGVVLRALVATALVVALFAVGAALAVAAAESARDVGVLKALGVTPAQVTAAFMLQALALAAIGLLLALPFGELLSWLLRARVSEQLAGFHFSRVTPAGTVLTTVAALPVVAALAAWSPARWSARLPPAAVLANE